MRNEAAVYHERLNNELKALCRTCDLRNTQSAQCKKCKTDCVFYNCKIAEYVLSEYSKVVIKKNIPIEHIIRGVDAHGYSGELRKTRVVTV